MQTTHHVAHVVLVSLAIVAGVQIIQGEQDRPTAHSHVTTQAMRVDGVLDEPAWASAKPIGPLLQSEPTEDAPATFQTDVRVLFDADYLYFGIFCHDTAPSGIVATQLARDADLEVDDRIVIVLDTFFDQRNGFFFSVNPVGARVDGQISNNAEDLSREWDGIWDARARITSEGWVTEIRIPFKTLRFKSDPTVWGLNVERQIKRFQEIDRWASPQQDLWVSNLAAAGQLTGLTGVRQGRGLDIRPYLGTTRDDGETKVKVGLDVAKSLTPSLTASVSINTDFAETENDTRQINLTRFDLFFPEKRTFFLEGAGVFDVAGLGGGSDLIPFFSRTVGLFDDQEVPILAGVKVSGRQSGFNIGLLDVQTRDTTLEEGPLAAQNLFAMRVSRNLFAQSWIGMIATRGNPSGEGANSLIGADARFATSTFREDTNLSADLFFLRTDDDTGEVAVDHAYGVTIDYPNDLVNAKLSFKRIGDAFKPAMGFAPRTGIRKTDLSVGFEPRPGRFGIRQLAFEQRAEIITDLDSVLQNWAVRVVPLGIRTNSGEEIEWRVTPTFERLNEPFEIADGVIIPPGDYRWTEHGVELQTASKRRWVLDAEYMTANFYGGTLRQFALGVVIKPNVHLGLVGQMERGTVRLAQDRFVTQVVSGGIDYAAANVTWSNLIQYESDSRVLGFQSRFRWILRPGNDLFLVVNRGWSREMPGRYVPSFDRGSVKVQYTFRR